MTKQLIITGLAQETPLEDLEASKTFLVINGGELRIPVEAIYVKKILEYKVNGNGQDEDPVYEGLSPAQEQSAAQPENNQSDEDDEEEKEDEEEGQFDESGIPSI